MPPTKEHLQAVFESLLKAMVNQRIKTWSEETGATKALTVRLGEVPAERRRLWIDQIKAVIKALPGGLGALVAQLGDSVGVAIKAAEQVKYAQLTDADVHPAANDQVKITLEAFLYATPIVVALDHALDGFTKEIDQYLLRAVEVETWLAARKQWCTNSRTELEVLVVEVDDLLAQVDALALTPFLTAWTAPVVKFRKAAGVVLGTPLATVWADADAALCTNFTLPAAQQRSAIEAVVGGAGSAAQQARMQLYGSVIHLDADTLRRLQPLGAAAPPLKTACTAMTQFYGTPWIICLGTIDSAAGLTRVLTHAANKDVVKALRNAAAKGSTVPQLSKAFDLMLSIPHWEDACIALNSLDAPEIACPDGVVAMSWVKIGSSWVPRAFSMQTAGLETDMACLKHMRQETGVKPSSAKLTLYFAELVAACREAVKRWNAAGQPAKFECAGINLGVGTWTIHVRWSFGSPQVFHVDSGYEQSAWVKHAN
ncbi:hypothetical protein B4N89_36395 [Embleya scabrispora]|uniref:Uncharacterized protein n=1 Tax=Embleya scabrispora TaxID=159449 RepID=A0A1T3NLK4_9ACTN|nr:hypothetical protein B4N89_36395 [Embleya scabrispora]